MKWGTFYSDAMKWSRNMEISWQYWGTKQFSETSAIEGQNSQIHEVSCTCPEWPRKHVSRWYPAVLCIAMLERLQPARQVAEMRHHDYLVPVVALLPNCIRPGHIFLFTCAFLGKWSLIHPLEKHWSQSSTKIWSYMPWQLPYMASSRKQMWGFTTKSARAFLKFQEIMVDIRLSASIWIKLNKVNRENGAYLYHVISAY